MAAIQIQEGFYSVGVLNPIMRIFDVVMRTEYGTSYNSYLLRGGEKTALIDTCHATYFDLYLENIREACDPLSIDYIVMNHCEPDHSGALEKLLSVLKNAKILVSQAGALYLKNITNRADLPMQVVKDGDSVDLGGRTLNFISAPFLHWPDSMFTFCPEAKALFTCDFFGAHFCEPDLYDRNMVYQERYEQAFKEYYDGIFAPFRPYVVKGLEKALAVEVDAFYTSHGPILTKDGRMNYAVEKYKEWSAEAAREHKLIPVFYCSAYGNTALLAESIREGILSALPDADAATYDLNEHDMSDMAALLNASDAFCLGSPTINADAVPPAWVLLSHVDAINSRKKPALVFGSFGWSGEAVPNLTARLTGLKMAPFAEGLRAQFVPSVDELKKAVEIGRLFAESLS